MITKFRKILIKNKQRKPYSLTVAKIKSGKFGKTQEIMAQVDQVAHCDAKKQLKDLGKDAFALSRDKLHKGKSL